MKQANHSLFGLPSVVEHCSNCLMTNQKPHSVNEAVSKRDNPKKGMVIHSDGLCDACHYSKKKSEEIDWSDREEQLLKKLEAFRRADGCYDCIVSGSGGKDSMMVAHLLKYKYGMHPLTITYAPLLYSPVGWTNMQNWINIGGFDNFLFSPNGRVSGILAKEALKNIYHPIQPFKFGLKQFASKMAVKFDIELVMYGEPWVEYGSAPTIGETSPNFEKSWYVNDSKDIFIGGTHIEALKEKYSLSNNDLHSYMPLRSEDLRGKKLTVENLGWYVKWDPQEAYYYAVDNCGFVSDSERTDGTYGKYSSIDDKFESLHFYCHFIKFGIGRTRFDASQEIRNGHISREEAISLAASYEGEFPKRYQKDCLDFMGISEDEFVKITDEFRSPHLWHRKNGVWELSQDLPEIARLRASMKDQTG